MTVGKHTVTVNCRNKRDGKQKAAQAILQVRILCALNIQPGGCVRRTKINLLPYFRLYIHS